MTAQRHDRRGLAWASQAIGFLGEVEDRRGRLSEAVLFADLAVGNAVDNDRFWDYPILHALACYPHAAGAEWTEAEHHAAESDKWAQMVGTATGLALAGAAKAAIAQAHGDASRLLANRHGGLRGSCRKF